MAFLQHLTRRTHRSRTAVIFDVGSGHVGAALAVVSSADSPPKIIWCTRTPMEFQKHIDFERFLSGMLQALKSVGEQVVKEGIAGNRRALHGKKVDTVFCVFSSPWYISQTRVITFNRKQPFDISEKFIEDILDRSEKQFEKSAALQRVRKKLGDAEVIERHIIQTALNGYPTNKPYGKRVRNVEVSLFLSMISKEVKTKVKETLDTVFHAHRIAFHSFALTSFSVIRDLFHAEEDFVLVDIGGEVTDVSLTRNGLLLETVSFPTGKHFLIRSIALDLNISPEEAHSLARMSLGKSAQADPKLEKTLADAEHVWTKSMQHALVEVGDSQLLPKTVFLTVDPDLGDWFKEVLQKDDFRQYTFTNESFTVITIGERELYRNCSVAAGAKKDPFLALDALFLQKLMHNNRL